MKVHLRPSERSERTEFAANSISKRPAKNRTHEIKAADNCRHGYPPPPHPSLQPPLGSNNPSTDSFNNKGRH